MNIAEALLQALKDHGAREIFGIPGDFALAFFKVIWACFGLAEPAEMPPLPPEYHLTLPGPPRLSGDM